MPKKPAKSAVIALPPAPIIPYVLTEKEERLKISGTRKLVEVITQKTNNDLLTIRVCQVDWNYHDFTILLPRGFNEQKDF